jgi:ribosomal protein S18 acetylase RimI-like enzyme
VHREVVDAPGVPGRLAAVVEWSRDTFRAGGDHHVLSVAVAPRWGRRGLGSALLRRALAQLSARAPATVRCEAPEDRPWGARLLERHGFALAFRNMMSELDLAALDEGALRGAVRHAEAGGPTLRTLGEEGVRDEALLRGMHALMRAAVADVPGATGEMATPYEEWRRAYVENPDLLPDGNAVALDGGRVVGMTQLWASQATRRILYTGFTGVARSHRRLGLATALKALVLGWAAGLRGEDGKPPVVRTFNAEVNPMLGINRRLGFVERPARRVYELRVPASGEGSP